MVDGESNEAGLGGEPCGERSGGGGRSVGGRRNERQRQNQTCMNRKARAAGAAKNGRRGRTQYHIHAVCLCVCVCVFAVAGFHTLFLVVFTHAQTHFSLFFSPSPRRECTRTTQSEVTNECCFVFSGIEEDEKTSGDKMHTETSIHPYRGVKRLTERHRREETWGRQVEAGEHWRDETKKNEKGREKFQAEHSTARVQSQKQKEGRNKKKYTCIVKRGVHSVAQLCLSACVCVNHPQYLMDTSPVTAA